MIGYGDRNNSIEQYLSKEFYTFKNQAKIQYCIDCDENANSIPLHLLKCTKMNRLKRNLFLLEDYIKRFIKDVHTFKIHELS